MKFLTTVFIFAGLIFLFNSAGIMTPSGGLVSGFLSGGVSYFVSSSLWTSLGLILSGTILVGAVASLFGRTPDVSWILALIASSFGGLVLVDMVAIYSVVNANTPDWMSAVILLIMGLMAYGFFISLIGWWRGADG